MRDPDDLFAALARSAFRRRQTLGAADLAYLRGRGMETVLRHAGEMIAARLAPAEPPNDGKQTPMRGHPVFVAQHATGTCCRGCLAKWHRIPKGRDLSDDERAYVVTVLERWLREADAAAPADGAAPRPRGAGKRPRKAEEDEGPPADEDPQMGLGL
jgi:predicted Fe-S protein YdhL (DUF1289 family)